LEVDLTTGKSRLVKLPVTYYSRFLGGASLAARILFDDQAYTPEPLSPENILIFLTGPLSGINFPGAGRVHIAARSPQTGGWGESSLGGFLAVPIKKSGYDGLILRGRADEPVYLEIVGDKKPRLLPASHLWGLDAYQTEDALHLDYPDQKIEVVVIGPAGERQIPLAALIHRKHNIAARTGMGAVMGSKNLKAIVIHGTGRIPIAEPDQLASLRSECNKALAEDYWSQRRKKWGTIGNLEWAVENRRTPTKNWQNVPWLENARQITGETLEKTMLTGRATCYGCPLACKRKVRVDDTTYSMEEGAGPEYETAASLGAMVMNDNLAVLLKANDMCNRLGLDTISVGATIAWSMEASEKGILPENWFYGQRLQWGDSNAILRLIEDIGLRQGVGELLCEGSAKAARIIGGDSISFAMQVKGLEIAYHHPRVARGMEITYATNPRGATHMESPDVLEQLDASDELWVKQIASTVDCSTLPNAYVVCAFISTTMGLKFMSRVISAVTGTPWDEESLRQTAERGWYLKRLFNFGCGIHNADDTLPQRIQDQLILEGCDHNDFNHILKLYQEKRGLDSFGLPAMDRLSTLGLDDLPVENWYNR
jgi:aldehyde:ferredoxin oxidoreductase